MTWQVKPLGDACKIKPPKSEARYRLSDIDMVSFVPMEDLGVDQKFLAPGQTRTLSLDEIAALDAESAEVLARIGALV